MSITGMLAKIRIIESVAENNAFIQKKYCETVETILVSSDDVLISGFGKFCLKKK